MIPVLLFAVPFVLALLLTPLIRRGAVRKGIVDRPETDPSRKIHERPVALLGGWAVWASFSIAMLTLLIVRPEWFVGGYLQPKYFFGLILGGLVLMLGGYLDDRFGRSPRQQIVWPILACLVIIGSGIGISVLTNPFGTFLRLDTVTWQLFTWHGTPYHLVLFADLFTFVWLMVSMYATKFLDGLDGLVSGVSVIGMLVIFFISMSHTVGQPETARVALLIAGSFAGFLVYNFHPASIFLGEGGSLLAGFFLGTLAIFSGGKVATALLILGVPLLDLLWVVVRRRFLEHRSPFVADKKHFHFRLLSAGLTQRQTVLALYAVTAAFGFVGVLTHGKAKVLALLGLVAFMGGWAVWASRRARVDDPPTS